MSVWAGRWNRAGGTCAWFRFDMGGVIAVDGQGVAPPIGGLSAFDFGD